MNPDSTPHNSISPNEATLDATDLSAASQSVSGGSQSREPRHRMGLIEGSGSGGMSRETQSLLRRRLRVMSLMLFSGFLVFFIWQLVYIKRPEFRNDLFFAHMGVGLTMGVCGLVLSRRCDICIYKLRLTELIILIAPASFFALLQYTKTSYTAENFGILPNPAGMWAILIFTYALFIPNTWWRAGLMMGAIALVPLVVLLVGTIRDENVNKVLWEQPGYIIEMTLVMILMTTTAVLGVRTIGTLRREAFVARQMGNYRLRERIGAGGMGEVFLAEHQMLKRPAAIKLIRPEKAGDPKVLARFEREVRATAELSHWNTVDIFDYGRTDDGTFYYVMEFLPGLNLQDLVREYGPLPPERVIHLLRQTCDALSEAHGAGLVHRDIKPANIFAAERGGLYDVAKLLDFGLVKPQSGSDESLELTQDGSITGSPLYMSPEQAASDHEPDARSDIYALGAVAYMLLTGQPPFEHERAFRVLMAHVSETPKPPTEIDPSIPADLEQVVLRCLEKAPADRYQTVRDLGDALAQCRAAESWSSHDAQQWWQGRAEQSEEELKPVAV